MIVIVWKRIKNNLVAKGFMIFNKKTIFVTAFSILLLGGLFYFLLSKKQTRIISENKKDIKTMTSLVKDRETESEKNNENIQDVNENEDVVEMESKNEKEEKLEEEQEEEIKKTAKKNVKSGDIEIKNKLVNWGFSKSSGRNIDTIILHSSYDALGEEPYDINGLIAEYKEYGVAPHYLIDRKGKIYRLVEDKNIAWHAGKSKTPDGRKNVNNFSIGIEIMNTKTDEYTKKQYQSVQNLIDYLKKKYKIKYILGHNEIAVGRKTDPWNFDWNKISIKK